MNESKHQHVNAMLFLCRERLVLTKVVPCLNHSQSAMEHTTKEVLASTRLPVHLHSPNQSII